MKVICYDILQKRKGKEESHLVSILPNEAKRMFIWNGDLQNEAKMTFIDCLLLWRFANKIYVPNAKLFLFKIIINS